MTVVAFADHSSGGQATGWWSNLRTFSLERFSPADFSFEIEDPFPWSLAARGAANSIDQLFDADCTVLASR
jgi:hypothetical protein